MSIVRYPRDFLECQILINYLTIDRSQNHIWELIDIIERQRQKS